MLVFVFVCIFNVCIVDVGLICLDCIIVFYVRCSCLWEPGRQLLEAANASPRLFFRFLFIYFHLLIYMFFELVVLLRVVLMCFLEFWA